VRDGVFVRPEAPGAGTTLRPASWNATGDSDALATTQHIPSKFRPTSCSHV
jgi:hypothetical protein